MGMYEDLRLADVLGPIANQFQTNAPLNMNDNDVIQLKRIIAPGSPWINVKAEPERQCGKWRFFFNNYEFIPKGCRCCWKVVWTGETLDQLFQIRGIQKEMNLVSKCGVEQRRYTGKLGYYQAFWYTDLSEGLKGARALWKKVVDTLAKDPLVAGCDVFLKRGCTEMERMYSPSDSWDEMAKLGQWDIQELFCNSVFPDTSVGAESSLMRVYVKRRWIEYAWEHKDPCVMEKYPNKYLAAPLVPPALRYNKSIHSEKDYNGYECSGSPAYNGGAKQIITEL